MSRCLTLALLFAWMFVAGCWPTKNPKNETRNDDLKMTEATTEEVPPTSAIFTVQRSTVPSRKSATTARAGPTQTDQEPTRESPLSFFTSDVKKLNIVVMVLASIVMLLAIILLILCVLRRNMQRKMQRMKEEKEEETTTTTTEGATPQCKETPSTESRFYNYATPQQPAVEYEVPYAHQQAMAVQIMAPAYPNPANNNVTNQIAPNGLPVTPMMDDDDYVNSRVFEAIVEDINSADQTINNQEYKIPRNATKRAGLMSNEALTNTSTLKDSRGYVVMLNYARPVEHQPKNSHNVRVEGHKQHVYDEPVKTERSTNTFSRNTIKTKIKIFQEKLKSDKSKHAVPAENAEKGTQTQNIRESMVKNTAYDTPRKV